MIRRAFEYFVVLSICLFLGVGSIVLSVGTGLFIWRIAEIVMGVM